MTNTQKSAHFRELFKDLRPRKIPQLIGLTSILRDMALGDSFITDDRPSRVQMWRLKPKKWSTRKKLDGRFQTWRVA